MKVILFVTIIVLGGLSLATWLCMHLEDHLEWREWHVPRGTEFISYPLEYGEHDGLLCVLASWRPLCERCFSAV